MATNRLVIGLHSWIIQDGNYRDLKQGDRIAFAVEFHARNLVPTESPRGASSLVHLGDARYSAVAKVIHAAKSWWVLDADGGVFWDAPPPREAEAGAWLRGEIWLGVDPYFYVESLAHQPDAPPLIYDWRIARIELQSAPMIEVAPRRYERDQMRLGWREIPETRAWDDDDGHADYLLHCERLGGHPRRSR